MDNLEKIMFFGIFILVIGAGIYSLYFKNNTNQYLKVGDVKIDSSNLGNILENVEEGTIVICSIEQNKCGYVNKIPLNNHD